MKQYSGQQRFVWLWNIQSITIILFLDYCCENNICPCVLYHL